MSRNKLIWKFRNDAYFDLRRPVYHVMWLARLLSLNFDTVIDPVIGKVVQEVDGYDLRSWHLE